MDLVYYDDVRLRRKGAKVESFDKELSELANQMLEKMYAARGIGLAAQQVGRDIMLTVIDLQRDANDLDFEYELDGKEVPWGLMMPLVLVNPEVKAKKKPTCWYEEGCLSFPEINADIERPEIISVSYQDLEGNPHTLICDGILSRCIQHEVDHLNGVLFIDRMPKRTVKKLWNKLEDLKREYRHTQQ